MRLITKPNSSFTLGNQLNCDDARLISNALKNNMSLSCLDLSHNCIGENGGIHLADGIVSNTIV